MTRLAIAILAALAVVAWLRRPQPDPYWGLAEQQLEEDDVQWDPWTRALSEPGTRQTLDEGLADVAAGRLRDFVNADPDHGYRLLTDPTYLEAIAIRSTQTGPLGPTA